MKRNFTYDDELYHYGVRGMRWRHRKQTTVTGEPVGKTGRDVKVTGDPRTVDDKVTRTMSDIEGHGGQGEVVNTYKTGSGPSTKKTYVIRRRRDLKDMRRAREKRRRELMGN